MTKSLLLPLALSAAAPCAIAGPCILFSKGDLPALREHARRPEYAAQWQPILNNAKSFADPQNAKYTDPRNVCPRKAKKEYVPQKRHDAVLTHHVGQALTARMEALGLAYQITGEERFGRHGAAVLAGFCRDYPGSHPAMAKGFAGGRGEMMYGLALGMDLLSECLTPEERAVVISACRDYLDIFVREFNNPNTWWYRIHNYNGINGGAAGCLALTLREDCPDKSAVWLAEAKRIVERWLSEGFDEEGAFLEGVGYSQYALANTVVFGDALRRNGMDDFFDHPAFARFPIFLALSKLPGEPCFDARNDSRYKGIAVLNLKLAEATGNGLYRWLWDEAGTKGRYLSFLWDNDIKPVSPVDAGVPNAMHFRGRGLCIWRTGWGKDAVMFSVEAGPYYPTTHNQADKGHFTLYGLGHRWATDSGYSNDRGEESRGQTLAHSCVLIDGMGQALSGAGYGTNGKILAYKNGPRLGYALVDAKEAYTENNKGIKGAGARRALRHTMFVYPHEGTPAYAVVLDDIEKDDAEHDFTWQMMLSANLQAGIDGTRVVLTPFSASANAFVGTPWTSAQDAVESVEPETRSKGNCTVAFDVTEPGEYALWARVRTRSPEPGMSDSFHVRVGDGEEVAWHMPRSNSWGWAQVAAGVNRDPFVHKLELGEQLVTIRRREPGAEMDCLLLQPAAAPTPNMVDAPSSPLFAEAESGTCSDPMCVERVEPTRTRLELHLDAGAPLTIHTDVFHPKDYSGPASLPRLRATTTAVNPAFTAVLLPLPSDIASPTVSFAAGPEARRITIDWGEGKGQDEILWPDSEPREPVLNQLR